MKKLAILALVALPMVGRCVPTPPSAAPAKTYLGFVNVDNALPAEEFKTAAEATGKYLNMNVKTFDEKKLDTAKKFDAAPVVVFVTKNEKPLVSPFEWSIINVSKVGEGNPDAEKKAMRLKKLFMRGMAFAAGCGASVEGQCSMFHEALRKGDLDSGKPCYTPGVYFPLQEILPAICGDGISVSFESEE